MWYEGRIANTEVDCSFWAPSTASNVHVHITYEIKIALIRHES